MTDLSTPTADLNVSESVSPSTVTQTGQPTVIIARTVTTNRRLDFTQIAVLCFAFFAFLAADVINKNTFERLPHLEDEFAYLYQARIFAGGYAFVPRSEDVAVYWQPFIIQPNEEVNDLLPRFGKYTPGFPLMLVPGIWLGLPWLVNAVIAMLNVALTYQLGRLLFNRHVGLIAALLLACSPVALILNASYMSHSSAMFLALIFISTYARVMIRLRTPRAVLPAHRPPRFRVWAWALIGGLAFGMLVASRPLTAIAIGLVPAVYALLSLYTSLTRRKQYRGRFAPAFGTFVLMAVFAIPTAALWPLYNYQWTGSPTTNTYTLQWSYDKVGFGVGYGPNREVGHTLEKGFRIAREDLKFYWRDLFGLTLSPAANEFLNKNLGYGWGVGIAWLLLLLGLIAGRKLEWIWVLAGMVATLVILQMAYWIGSSVNGSAVYSTRYYYEVTFASCLVAAFGLHRLYVTLFDLDRLTTRRTMRRVASVVGLAALLVVGYNSAFNYTPARMAEPLPPEFPTGIYRYNEIGTHQLERLERFQRQMGEPDRDVLLVQIEVPNREKTDNWRNYGAMLAETSPFLNSRIIVARVFRPSLVPEFLARYPNRTVIYQVGDIFYTSLDTALQAPES